MATKLSFLTDEHHFALANVAIRAAQLDAHIEETVAMFLVDKPATAKFILHNTGADRLIGLLQAMLVDHFPADKTEADNLITAIKSARGSRNDLLHQLWGPAEEADKATVASIRPYREDKIRFVTASDIQAVATKLLECTTSLIQWSEVFHADRRKAWL